MNARTEALLRYLEEQHDVLRRAVESVPPERATKRPARDRWSAAEILEHIAIVESRIEKLFTSKVAESRPASETHEASLSGQRAWDRRWVLNRSRPVTANPAVHPTGKLSFADAWAAAERSYESFCAAVAASDGAPLGSIVHPHPVFGPLNLHSWVEFVAGHEARHAAQIRECSLDG